MEKTRNPITGKNSSPNKNSLPNNKRKKLVTQSRILQSLLVKMIKAIDRHFVAIMSMFAFFEAILVFLYSSSKARFAFLFFLFCLLCIIAKKAWEKANNVSTWDKISNFKRFTHKTVNGEVYIKKAEFEQAILYLQEVEDFLGKTDDDKSSPVG